MKIMTATMANQVSKDALNQQWEDFLQTIGDYIHQAAEKGKFSCQIPISNTDYQAKLFPYLLELGYQVEVSETKVFSKTGNNFRDFIISWKER